jgi:hypothetical protein
MADVGKTLRPVFDLFGRSGFRSVLDLFAPRSGVSETAPSSSGSDWARRFLVSSTFLTAGLESSGCLDGMFPEAVLVMRPFRFLLGILDIMPVFSASSLSLSTSVFRRDRAFAGRRASTDLRGMASEG